MKKLSHLAYIVLGVVADEEPCSGYTVMMTFQRSSSTYFSGSAGAIYPLLNRLVEDRLLKVVTYEAGSRTRQIYTITKKGQTKLDAWLAGPVTEDEVAFTVDLMRTRVVFFDRLTKPQRRKFVRQCRSMVQSRVKETQRRMREEEGLSVYDIVSLKSMLLLDKARLLWLRTVEEELC